MTNGANAPKLVSGQTNPEEDLPMMSLQEHLTELRSRLVRSLLAIIVIFFSAFSFASPLIRFLEKPLLNALPEGHKTLHFTGPMDVFIANIKVAFVTALVAGAPIWLYQFWKFVEPALFPKEKRMILPFVVISVLLFFGGVSFCFFLMLPMALEFLIQLGLEVGVPIITISDYLSLLILLVLAFGVMFETPLIIVLLAMLDLVSAETLAKHRKIVAVLILIVAAVLTPPDPISQLALATPTYLMYEAAIVIIRMIKREAKPKGEVVKS